MLCTTVSANTRLRPPPPPPPLLQEQPPPPPPPPPPQDQQQQDEEEQEQDESEDQVRRSTLQPCAALGLQCLRAAALQCAVPLVS